MVKNGILFLLLSNLLLSSVIMADDYYVSYYLYTKNFKVLNEKLRFSKAMVPFKSKGNTICKIVSDSDNINFFIKEKREDILSCLFKEGIFVSSYGTYSEIKVKKDTIVLKILPKPIQVIFNNGLVIIRKVRD